MGKPSSSRPCFDALSSRKPRTLAPMFKSRQMPRNSLAKPLLPTMTTGTSDGQRPGCLHEKSLFDMLLALLLFTLSGHGLIRCQGQRVVRRVHCRFVSPETAQPSHCLLYTSPSPTRLRRSSYAVFCLKKKK